MTENSEKLTYHIVVATNQSQFRVMEPSLSLDKWETAPTCRSYYAFVDQGFRPTWRVE